MKRLFLIILLCLGVCLHGAERQWIILTGGPGVGKTSLVNHFARHGYPVINEAATDLIRERLAEKIEQPWNQDGFNMSVLELLIHRQSNVEVREANVVFMDRSPVDVLTYSFLQKDRAHDQITALVDNLVASQLYHKKVFLIENLGNCEQNDVRPETLEETLRIESHIEDHYRRYNFEVVRIPSASIEERAHLILKHLELN